MEGFKDFCKSMFRILVIIFALVMFIIAGVQRKTIKDLERELSIYNIVLEIKQIKIQ